MARTDWDAPHADLEGLTDEGVAKGKELTGEDKPTLHSVLKAAWEMQEEDTSAVAFSKSDLAQSLFPGISPRAIDTRISKTIKPEVEAEQKEAEDQEITINLFEAHGCEMNRAHVAIQKGRAYREPVLVRITSRRMPPYGRVEVGDVVFLKVSGGPVVRQSTVKSVYSFDSATEHLDEMRELTQGTALHDDEDYWAHVSSPTGKGQLRRYATVMLLDEWEDLEHRVKVHPPMGVGSSWVTIRTDRHIESYLVGERQLPKREKQRKQILNKHEGQGNDDG